VVPAQSAPLFNPIENLLSAEPLDIALHTFQFLSYRDLVSLTQVCKSWKNAVINTKSLQFSSVMKKLETYGIIDRLYRLEATMAPKLYIHKQTEISSRMRAILTDWLLQVNNEFENSLDTGFLAMQIVDRYLSKWDVKRNKLQLVGIASLLVASKMEETHYPDLGELLYLCDNIYTREQLVEMESTIMRGLNHSLHSPTILHFLRYFLKESPCSKKEMTLALYISEQVLLDYNMLQFRPSRVALAIFLYVKHKEIDHLHADLELFNIPLEEVYAPASVLVSMLSCQSEYFLQAILLRFSEHADHAEGDEEVDAEFVAWLGQRYPEFYSHTSAFSSLFQEPTKGGHTLLASEPAIRVSMPSSPTQESEPTNNSLSSSSSSSSSSPSSSSSSPSASTSSVPIVYDEDVSFAAYIANLADPNFFTGAASIHANVQVVAEPVKEKKEINNHETVEGSKAEMHVGWECSSISETEKESSSEGEEDSDSESETGSDADSGSSSSDSGASNSGSDDSDEEEEEEEEEE
jgi:hypothetical protein